MDAVDEGDKGGSLSRECKLPLEPFDRGSVGDSALNASPADLVRRSSAIFWRRSSGGGSGGWLAMLRLFSRCGGVWLPLQQWSWSGARGWRANSFRTGGVVGISGVAAVSAAAFGRFLAFYRALKQFQLSINQLAACRH